jgi:thermostable 8-oxoguanine DNA glycosylase
MIDPLKITNYERTEEELQEFLLFSIVVAGKNSAIQSKKLSEFLTKGSPFDLIKRLNEKGDLLAHLQSCKMGQYGRIVQSFLGVLKFEGKLSTVSLIELASIKGIGFKTANFFLLHSRKSYIGAVLDTHILKFLRAQGYDAPKSTPPLSQYPKWEQVFLDLCARLYPTQTIADVDLSIWTQYARKA